MLKIFRNLLITFVVGLTFIGIGSGIAFAEFAGVEYGGIKTLQSSQQTTTDEYHFSFDEDQQSININNYNYYPNDNVNQINVEADDSLKKNEIIFVIEHPVDTRAYVSQEDEYGEKADGTSYQRNFAKFNINIYNSEFSVFKYTDAFVEALKENRIYDYQFQINSNITVKVAPSMVDHVYLHN